MTFMANIPSITLSLASLLMISIARLIMMIILISLTAALTFCPLFIITKSTIVKYTYNK